MLFDNIGFWPVIRLPLTSTWSLHFGAAMKFAPFLVSAVSSINGKSFSETTFTVFSSSFVKLVSVLPLTNGVPSAKFMFIRLAGPWQTEATILLAFANYSMALIVYLLYGKSYIAPCPPGI